MSLPSQLVVERLRWYLSDRQLEQAGDAELLRRFVDTGHSDPFASLVQRHGPMVLSLARRVLRDHQLAEDVFQATFLVLARKARAIRGEHALPAWLHSVAFRLAVRAKKSRERCREQESRVCRTSSLDPLDALTVREFLTILDEELCKLPEKYRLPIILCHLEGLTHEEIARRLDLCLGVVKGRLERGRAALRKRLARRGLGLGIAVAGLLERSSAASAVPPILAQATVQAALTGQGVPAAVMHLAERAMKTMFLTKLRWDVPKGVLASKWTLQDISALSCSLSRDGKTLTGGGNVLCMPAAKEKIRLDCGEDGTVEQPVVFAPDGALIAGDCGRLKNNTISPAGLRIWETVSGQSIAQFKAKSWNCQLLFHPSQRFLATDNGNAVQLWDVVSGKVVATRTLPKGNRSNATRGSYASCLAFTPDGRQLATGHADGTILLWDLTLPKVPAVRLGQQEMETLWTDLKDADAGKAWRAVWRLADAPDDVVAFMGKRLKAVALASAHITGPLLADLNSDSFAKRETAGKRLKELGLLAEPALRASLNANPPLEVRQRVEALLNAIVEAPSPLTAEELRDLRAVAVLARIPAVEARQLLQALAKGVDSARLTIAARAALAK
jgi:RNA polymerase sigma factor (sigma-70 family)